MNLYTHRDSNIRKTWALFGIFLVLIIGLGWLFARVYNNSAILYFAVFFSTFTSIISYWYSDKIVLAMARAIPVSRENARELYNIVENLCITAGLPVPKIYIIDESAPNAFATGRSPKKSAIAVTRGLLEKLNKTELEGVIAHELSHIGNRDMLLSTVVVILVGFVSIISDIFWRSAFWGGRRDNSRNSSGGVFFLLGIIFSILAPISAMLIQLAISRKREFLADASGALLTRYPEGLASALQKIAADSSPLSIAKNATAHLWLSDPFSSQKKQGKISWFQKLFMTHPPIEERIAALRGMKI